jgi:hypothetical protein
MKVIFRSKDFASVEALGYGFNNRRPMANPWQYQGRVQHRQWKGSYECAWQKTDNPLKQDELLWTAQGDGRLFALAAALKSKGFEVDVEQ